MTILRKIAAAFCALSIAAAPISSIVCYADNQSDTLLSIDYETDDLPVFDKFEGSYIPMNTVVKDEETGNSYGDIDASHSADYSGEDWFNGGYALSGEITSGVWEISFKFNCLSGNTYSNISLVNIKNVPSDPYGQFKLIGIKSNEITVGGKSLSGSLKPTAGNWYDYKMKLDKNANTYEVEISDGENTASGNGNISKSHAFDGLMFGAAMHAYMDDIVIKKYRGAPEVSVAELLDEDGNVQEYADPSTAAIRLVFTEEMDGESLADTVILSGAAAGERILSSDGCEYIIKIDDILKPDTELLLEVTGEAVSAGGIKIKAPYSMKIKVSDPDILLNIDYEDNVPQIIMWDGTSTYDYLTENSGNKYMKIVTSYSGTGYKLKQEIPKDGGDYSISFDFMLPELTSSTTRYLCLNEALPSGNGSSDAAYNQFGLLKTENRKFCVNGEAADGLEAEKNVWYSYKIDFNRKTRQYSLKITQRDDEEAGAAVLSGTIQDASYGDGMPEKVYNSIKFHYKNTICIDNIYVKKTAGSPKLSDSSIAFLDKNGDAISSQQNAVSLLTDAISLNFSESMNMRTVRQNISLADNDGNDIYFDCAADGTYVYLKNIDLEENKKYTITVNGDISSSAGAKLYNDGKSFKYEFTTSGRQFVMSLGSVSTADGAVERFKDLTDGSASVVINYENTYDESKNAVLIIAYYSENGSRISSSAYLVTAEEKSKGQLNADVTILKPEGAASVNFMLWKSFASAEPVSKMLKY